jgi:hypothetical protein
LQVLGAPDEEFIASLQARSTSPSDPVVGSLSSDRLRTVAKPAGPLCSASDTSRGGKSAPGGHLASGLGSGRWVAGSWIFDVAGSWTSPRDSGMTLMTWPRQYAHAYLPERMGWFKCRPDACLSICVVMCLCWVSCLDRVWDTPHF